MKVSRREEIYWLLVEYARSLSAWYLFFLWVIAAAVGLFYLALHGIW